MATENIKNKRVEIDPFREQLIELLYENVLLCNQKIEGLADDVLDLVDRSATSQKHGRWIVHNKGQNNWVECSECNTVGSPFWKRCPICEAKMEVDLNGV